MNLYNYCKAGLPFLLNSLSSLCRKHSKIRKGVLEYFINRKPESCRMQILQKSKEEQKTKNKTNHKSNLKQIEAVPQSNVS